MESNVSVTVSIASLATRRSSMAILFHFAGILPLYASESNSVLQLPEHLLYLSGVLLEVQ